MKTLQEKVREASIEKPFKPEIVYVRAFDRICAIAEDCRVREVRISQNIVLYERFPLENPTRYVGFYLKGAKQFSKNHSLPICGKIRVIDILKLLSHNGGEDMVTKKLVDEAILPIIDEHDLHEIEFS